MAKIIEIFRHNEPQHIRTDVCFSEKLLSFLLSIQELQKYAFMKAVALVSLSYTIHMKR